ncbi:MAG: HNH endonuclease [Chthonomonadaceae bacterium]|nr:HNH endonuclease [Chthonomonadaceae bacterium]
MSTIALTKGQVALVDPDDRDFLLAIGRWCFSNSGYAVHYTYGDAGQRKVLYMHRLVMQRILGHPIPPDLQVDHINLNRTHNTRDNLRLATRSQNQAHKDIGVNNTSLYKGVSWNHGKWEARIKYGHRRLHLGRYEDALTAAQVYDAASRLLYGDFAGCNFPHDPTPLHVEAHLTKALTRYPLS